MKTKQLELSDKRLFSINIGKRITKLELHNKEKGSYPVYSANVYTPFRWVDSLLINDFSNELYLRGNRWNLDDKIYT